LTPLEYSELALFIAEGLEIYMPSLSEVCPICPVGDWFESYLIEPMNCSDDFDLGVVLDTGAAFELGKYAVSVLP
jgi:hypothetical protein